MGLSCFSGCLCAFHFHSMAISGLCRCFPFRKLRGARPGVHSTTAVQEIESVAKSGMDVDVVGLHGNLVIRVQWFEGLTVGDVKSVIERDTGTLARTYQLLLADDVLDQDSRTLISGSVLTLVIRSGRSARLTDIYAIDRHERHVLSQNLTGTHYISVQAVHQATGEKVEVRCFPKHGLRGILHTPDLNRKISLLREMSEIPGLVRLDDVFEDSQYIYLVFESFEGGDLLHLMVCSGRFSELQAAMYMRRILQIISDIHRHSVCHRHISHDSIVFKDESAIQRADLKLHCFEFACSCGAGSLLRTKVGVPSFVAPEVIAGSYDQSCDVWSCGVLLFCLLGGYQPFSGASDVEILDKVRVGHFEFAPEIWGGVSADAQDLIRGMLTVEPTARCSLEEARSHKWIVDASAGPSDSLFPVTLLQRLRSMLGETKGAEIASCELAKLLDAEGLQVFFRLCKAADAQDGMQELLTDIRKAPKLSHVANEIAAVFNRLGDRYSGPDGAEDRYAEVCQDALEQCSDVQNLSCWLSFAEFDRLGTGALGKHDTFIELVESENAAWEAGAPMVWGWLDTLNDIREIDGSADVEFAELMHCTRHMLRSGWFRRCAGS